MAKRTLYKDYGGPRLPREIQIKRINQVIAEELTPIQREILVAYYMQNLRIPAIARQRGIQKSSVWRTLKRAERRLRQYLQH